MIKKRDSEFAYRAWRKKRGVKLVMTIVPYKKEYRAACIFEGKKYFTLGRTNVEALNEMFSRIGNEANLD